MIDGLSDTFMPTGRLMKALLGGRFSAAAALLCTIASISLGPIPLWNRMRAVPYEPADKMTRPLDVRGMIPFGPSEVSFVWTPVMRDPLRTTLETMTYCLYAKLERALAVW